jgi:hypothetical protein
MAANKRFRESKDGKSSRQGWRHPGAAAQPSVQTDPLWRDLGLFYEYFHAETGSGLGAAHQTGWTGLLAKLVLRRYEKDLTPS